MKTVLIRILAFCTAVFVLALSGCSPVDNDYGTESKKEETVSSEVSVPEIKSTDTVMPIFFDISLYDEQNYSKVYLGKKFEYKITVAGTKLDFKNGYDDLLKKGWSISEEQAYTEQSTILAGKQLKIKLVNEYGKMLNAIVFNDTKSSKLLKKCKIVGFEIAENQLVASDTKYSEFWINGVSNLSAITDIIEYLGAPSHFHAEENGLYLLDWFLDEGDKRSGISVCIDVERDCVSKITVTKY